MGLKFQTGKDIKGAEKKGDSNPFLLKKVYWAKQKARGRGRQYEADKQNERWNINIKKIKFRVAM